MNIDERASWLANDLNEGFGLDLSETGVLAVAVILRVQFLQVEKATQQAATAPAPKSADA